MTSITDTPDTPDAPLSDEATAFRIVFAERFNDALNQHGSIPHGYGRVQAVTSLFGVSRTTAGKWIDGEGLPELWRIPLIARRLNVDVTELLGSMSVPTNVDQSYVTLDIHTQEEPEDASGAYLHPETLQLMGLPPGSTLMHVTSDEMAGYVGVGDSVIYNPGVKRIGTGSDVYIFRVQGRYVLRRARRTLRDEIHVTCEAQDVPPEIFQGSDFTADKEDEDRIFVVGRVVARLVVHG